MDIIITYYFNYTIPSVIIILASKNLLINQEKGLLMMYYFNKAKKLSSGIGMTCLIAVIAVLMGKIVPIIGGSILALFIGILCNFISPIGNKLKEGLDFVSKRLLRLAIILLGTGLSISKVLEVGKYSLFVMIFTLTAAFGSAYVFGNLLKINWKLSNLIGAGTGICGGSAIAALSPVLEADDTDIAYAMSATFIFDVLMILLFPLMGKALNLSDLAFGLWTGTAVNDTSSVVAAAYAFSDAAGNFATIVKLTRTTSIVPITLLFSIITSYHNREKKLSSGKATPGLSNLFPWFILIFVLGSIINTLGLIPANLYTPIKQGSKFLMAMALAAVGLKTNLRKMLQSGIQPMILGFIVSLIVVLVSLIVQFLSGQI